MQGRTKQTIFKDRPPLLFTIISYSWGDLKIHSMKCCICLDLISMEHSHRKSLGDFFFHLPSTIWKTNALLHPVLNIMKTCFWMRLEASHREREINCLGPLMKSSWVSRWDFSSSSGSRLNTSFTMTFQRKRESRERGGKPALYLAFVFLVAVEIYCSQRCIYKVSFLALWLIIL